MKSGTLKTKGFNFKQFSIADSHSGMPVSTDGVLLGAWSDFSCANNLLDIGTGTGLLSLMSAQRFPTLRITAVDIDEHAIEAARDNFAQSPWRDRLEVQQGDVLTLNLGTHFDAIICNPPYFNSGEQAKMQQRATARHTDSLSHWDLLARTKALLNQDGRASFVLPDVEGAAFIQLAQTQGWHLSRLCRVRPSEQKPASRLLFELRLQATAVQEQSLTIREVNGYSAEFVALTQDFYLKM